MELIILGTGANAGTPQFDCQCNTCQLARKDINGRRTRASIAIKINEEYIIFDATPDIRQQLLKYNIFASNIKAIFISHAHFDHMIGLLEFCAAKPLKIPVYCHKRVYDSLAFIYPKIERIFDFRYKIEAQIGDINIEAFEVPHTTKDLGSTYGFNIKSGKSCFSYIIDTSDYCSDVLKKLEGNEFAILDGTFYEESIFNHISMKETMKILKESPIPKVYFSHISHSEGTHESLIKKLMNPKFDILRDGQIIKL